MMDKKKIRRVSAILIRNAVNYAPEGGTVLITIREEDYQGIPVFACGIQDTGIGIAKEDLPNLFTKFFRAKNAVQAVADGAGLRLYFVKNFIEAHGGFVQVESELNKGSNFRFVLPRA